MNIDFRHGPYDGLCLTREQVLRCTSPLLIHFDNGVRLFALMPRSTDWAEVFAGSALAGDEGLYPYELILTPGIGCGAEFHDAVENGTFDRVVAEGRIV